jgi:hypothetical protein
MVPQEGKLRLGSSSMATISQAASRRKIRHQPCDAPFTYSLQLTRLSHCLCLAYDLSSQQGFLCKNLVWLGYYRVERAATILKPGQLGIDL